MENLPKNLKNNHLGVPGNKTSSKNHLSIQHVPHMHLWPYLGGVRIQIGSPPKRPSWTTWSKEHVLRNISWIQNIEIKSQSFLYLYIYMCVCLYACMYACRQGMDVCMYFRGSYPSCGANSDPIFVNLFSPAEKTVRYNCQKLFRIYLSSQGHHWIYSILIYFKIDIFWFLFYHFLIYLPCLKKKTLGPIWPMFSQAISAGGLPSDHHGAQKNVPSPRRPDSKHALGETRQTYSLW